MLRWGEDAVLLWTSICDSLLQVVGLVDAKADINFLDHDKRSLLHMVCADGRSELAHYLIAKGASLSERDGYGFEPLKYAILKGHIQLAKHLEHAGAQLSKESRLDLECKLCRCAAEGDHSSVEALTSSGPFSPQPSHPRTRQGDCR